MIILKRYKVTDINKFKRFIFLTTLLIGFIFTSFINAYSKDISQFDYITIQEGDTLWSIAANYSSNKDIREVIYHISKVNNIHNSHIYPGDIIKVPLN
ncbi:MAG: LysM peptidoglycan-binding domain-containing protein [Tissierellia bacterium]|nr:LysM peptidoglycan-binding domain-containing protein [Tissierellia bacterium]